jgi:transketolase
MKAPIVYQPDQSFTVGKAVELIEGSDITLMATGLLVAEAIRASEALESEGVSARVIDLHTIKPLDRDAIARAAAETGAIVVAEEHLVDGGLGVRVAQVVSEPGLASWSSWAYGIRTPSPARRKNSWTNMGCCPAT